MTPDLHLSLIRTPRELGDRLLTTHFGGGFDLEAYHLSCREGEAIAPLVCRESLALSNYFNTWGKIDPNWCRDIHSGPHCVGSAGSGRHGRLL